MTTAPSPFSSDLPTFQTAWDASSLNVLQECPRKYQYSILEGWRTLGNVLGPLTFGSIYHNSLERIEKLEAAGTPHEDAILIGVREAMAQSGTYEACSTLDAEPKWEAIDWRDANDCRAHAEIEVRFTPWPSIDTKRTRETLIRSIIWYFEEYSPDSLPVLELDRGDGKGPRPALELSFSFSPNFQSPSGRPILWCGHIDKLASFNLIPMVVERKHTAQSLGSYYFDNYTLNNQITGYILAGQVLFGVQLGGAVIDAAQVAVGFTRFQRSLQYRSEPQVAEWLRNLRYWVALAEHYAEINFWPMNFTACNHYGGCRYRAVCSMPESMRAQALATHFIQQRWNPLELRDE